ncbi:protein RRNAD1 [Diachasma alloeum]|uniref:protein RRNAD1 n=1 Tax=Diachasma alloeum TaxID=454923 RepID=UPI0007381625|nr:protein RRNAD1 [Diachasma alloeum]
MKGEMVTMEVREMMAMKMKIRILMEREMEMMMERKLIMQMTRVVDKIELIVMMQIREMKMMEMKIIHILKIRWIPQGYVCQLLHHLFNYRVLGLESNPSITATASHRRDTLHPLSRPSVQYFCLKVTEDSAAEIEELLKSFTNNENEKFCLIGLHSCGDLSANALRLFRDMENASLLIMMSCCYHKIECLEGKKGFKNFPMSRGLGRECEGIGNPEGVGDVLGRTFMRLACQEPAERWEKMAREDHEVHSICLMARGVLELFCHKNQIKLTKTRRKSVRSSKCRNFEAYFQNFTRRYNFNGQQLDKKYYEEINQLWEENTPKLKLSEVYTGLQLLLQAPAEYLVLNDRRCWLEEQGFSETKILSVLDRKLSPRSHAIVSSKTNPITV